MPATRPARVIAILALSGLAGGLAACDEEEGRLDAAPRDSAVVPGDSGATPDSAPADTATSCGNQILAADPADGAEGVLLSAEVVIQTQREEPGASVRVLEGDLQLPGTLEVQGKLLRWRAQTPLRADRAYRTELTWSCGTDTFDWRSTDATSRLSLASGRLVAPATDLDLPSVLADLLVRVESYGVGRIALLVGPADGGAQAPCVPTTQLGGIAAPSGDLEATATEAWVLAAGQRVQVAAMRVLSGLDPRRWRLDPPTVVFDLDLTPLATTLLGRSDATVAEACARVGGCAPCRGTGARACVTVRLEDVPVSGTSRALQPRSASDVAQDAACR